MDSKSLPLILGVVILLAGAVFLLGRTLNRAPAENTLPPVMIDSPSDPGPNLEGHPSLKKGFDAIRESRWEAAVVLLEEVPLEDPGYLIALFNMAVLYEQIGKPEISIERFNTLRALQDESAEVYAGMSRSFARIGDYVEAERFALRALELQPQNKPVRYHVAFIRTAEGDTADAVNAYRRAMLLDPAGDYVDQAVVDLRRLHESAPQHPDTHYALAFIANARGELGEEVQELSHYLELSPTGPAVALAEARLPEARSEAGVQ